MYAIFTDTDSDITPSVAKKYGYNLISMPYIIGEKEIYPYVDFEEFDVKGFYQSLREGTMPKTCAINSESYVKYFEPFLKEGKDILYVHFSSAMSGTFDAMRVAIDELKVKYPNNSVYTIDTKGITICEYTIVCEIGDLYKQGKSIKEIMDWAKEEVDKFAIFFYAKDLNFFRRSGRVKNFKAVVGNLIGIHPILTMGKDGMMDSIDKVRGDKATLNKIMSYVVEFGEDIKSHHFVIGHSDALEDAKILGEKLKEEFGEDLSIEYVAVNPTAGSHCGPDGVGVCFHAKHRF